MSEAHVPRGFSEMVSFGLLEAILGRRSRRFFMGAHIPDGYFEYKSRFSPEPLSELEKLLVVAACGTNTSWHYMHYRAQRYAPYLSNYCGSAGGRTFPSSAGFHTSKTFFTDDSGVYLMEVRDVPALRPRQDDGSLDESHLLADLKDHIIKVDEGRLQIPCETPFVEAHNTWVVNKPGTLLVIPVGDLAQHVLLNICYMLQNGLVITDDINRCAIPGLEKFTDMVDINNTWPLTFVEQWSMAELSAELSTSCYAGTLILQAMGLGGWMFNGMDPFSVLGASGKENAAGLRFRYDTNENWPYPNPTGRKGVMEGMCPPHYADMREAVEAVCRRKFGPGGPFNAQTDGPWKESVKVRTSAQVHDDRFRECVALQAQYVYDRFGKFPGTVPSMFVLTYLQAHHLDLEFYDQFYKPGAYLSTHREHMKNWHSK